MRSTLKLLSMITFKFSVIYDDDIVIDGSMGTEP